MVKCDIGKLNNMVWYLSPPTPHVSIYYLFSHYIEMLVLLRVGDKKMFFFYWIHVYILFYLFTLLQ